MSTGRKYYGKYRGTVVNNVDPRQLGRIQATVPDVSQVAPGTWAMPCLPVVGLQEGLFALPPLGAGVWIEFEQGDPDFPVWSGCFIGSMAEMPALALTVPPGVSGMTLQTKLQNGIVVSDVPGTGGILLKSSTGASILINETGINIQNGQGATITMTGPTVNINGGAITVT